MNSNDVIQFKIELQEVKPKIWRRIQVPDEYTFWDLHVAIQDSMGWYDYHLHEFAIKDPATNSIVTFGIPDYEFVAMDDDTLPGWEAYIRDFFSKANPKAKHSYDFGDGWNHSVVFEGMKAQSEGINYPRCLDGRRACPPEDCGGAYGYEVFLDSIEDPSHEMHERMLEWIGGDFDPEHFDPSEVEFDDPEERWKLSFQI